MISEKEIINVYNDYCERFNELITENVSKYVTSFKEASKKVVYEEYCSGSDMFLGYYDPSPVFDLVVGNVHRGRIVKRLIDKTEVTHKYGFDENGRLLTVKFIVPKNFMNFDERAVLEYDGNIVNVICFRNTRRDRGISHVAQLEYDDTKRIIKITDCDVVVDRCATIRQESYTYGNDGIESAILWDCDAVDEENFEFLDSMYSEWFDKEKADKQIDNIKKTGFICTVDSYRFCHDEDGYITSYEAVDKYGETTVYKVAKYKRRKV